MVAETLPQIVRMWKDEDYSYDGKFFSMPSRNVLPKPYSKPHPAIWMAAGSPSTFDLAAELGVGVLCFGFSTPDQLTPLVARYKEKIGDCKNPVGGFVNDNVMITTTMICMEDGAKARKTFLEADSNYHLSLVFRYLDTFPKPPGVPEWPAIVPAMDAASLDSVIASGDVAVGTPDEVNKAIERYVATGADQLSFGMLSSSMSIESCEEAVETFGKHLLPAFDKDPDAPHHQAAPRRRRFLALRPFRRPRLVTFQPEVARFQAAVDLLGHLSRRAGSDVDAVPFGHAVPLELGPQVVDHVGVGQRTCVLRLRPAVLHPLLHEVDRRPQHGVMHRELARLAGSGEEVEHERVEDALADREVAPGGEGGDGFGGCAEHDPVLGVRLFAPWLDGPASQLGEEPVEVEADRELVAIRHQRRHRGLAAAGGAGHEEEATLRHARIIAPWIPRAEVGLCAPAGCNAGCATASSAQLADATPTTGLLSAAPPSDP